ncbi:DUF2254 domain-containing protein [Pseudomonas putida]|uniref:DUF2254 domain-containing protein n=1 Tax=Pseudomonas TaxID=286 RepID=UPI00159CFF0B|nr:DUF2254 domain-containing protein [Pseudomonas putida]NVN64322.1 DUF2254 domain-containing protein [Pseudomonas putida]NVN69330.1 DUF2254 domain-containing protein [Pseudomonas putida]
MIARWRWLATRIAKRLWFRATLFSLLGVVTALVAVVLKDAVPVTLPARIGADAVDKILGIIASSMLAVTTFSLSTMVSAYSAASSGVTPRATSLVMEDATTQNALATFIGSFLFSLVGIIALSTGAYGTQGRVVLFTVTIAVVVLIIYTLLRWIDHLSKLGRVGETIDRVEKAVIKAIEQRVEHPCLGGAAYPPDFKFPGVAHEVKSSQTGYVQHIDVLTLNRIATDTKIRIYLEVLPGTFVHEGMVVARAVAVNGEPLDDNGALDLEIFAAVTIGLRRTFEHDPRFGLSVLSEIASRALSPAVNDPGTAIDIIGRGIRCLTCWGKLHPVAQSTDNECPQVYVHALLADDLFDDFFAPISRDGAALQEVNLRLIKALVSLAHINPRAFQPACSRHAARLLAHAGNGLVLQQDKDELRALAAELIGVQ